MKDRPEKPFQAPADGSGAHDAVVGELGIVIDHMKRSNGFIKTTNKELITLNKRVAEQNFMLFIGALIGLVLLGGLFYSLYEQRGLRLMLQTNAAANHANVKKLAELTDKLSDTQRAAEDTKKAVEEQPKITVKPADTSDPTSRPVLVVVPPQSREKINKLHNGPAAKSPSALPTLEFPLGPPSEEKK